MNVSLKTTNVLNFAFLLVTFSMLSSGDAVVKLWLRFRHKTNSVRVCLGLKVPGLVGTNMDGNFPDVSDKMLGITCGQT